MRASFCVAEAVFGADLRSVESHFAGLAHYFSISDTPHSTLYT